LKSGFLKKTDFSKNQIPKTSLLLDKIKKSIYIELILVFPEIRHHRIAHRAKHGNIDNFDRYMAQDTIRSERIESFLVWLAKNYLDAEIIENNDLNDAELAKLIEAAK